MLDASSSTQRWVASEPAEEKVLGLLRRAQQQASAQATPALVRWHADLPMEDPWLRLPDKPTSTKDWIAWHDGRTGLTVAALGAAQAWNGAGPGRFAAASTFGEGVAATCIEGSVDGSVGPWDGLPLLFGGFAFAEAAPRGPWAGWPAGRLTVPEQLFYRTKERCGWVFHQRVARNSNVHDLATALSSALRSAAHPMRHKALNVAHSFTQSLDESCAHWCERVCGARGAVAAGRLNKVVLARAVEMETDGDGCFGPLQTLTNLRLQHAGAVCFGYHLAGMGTFLGATPEQLIRVTGHSIETSALAGTTGRATQNADEDGWLGRQLISSAKDKSEHEVVVAAIEEALRPACTDLEISPTPQLLKLRNVQHLETAITGCLRKRGVTLQLVERLHPTPAVGGWPRQEALRWLESEEDLERGWYAAPVGWLGPRGDGVFAVALRSALLRQERAWAFAGAGIVSASRPQAEWRETELKLQAIRSSIAVCGPTP